MQLQTGAASHVGRVRAINEDAFLSAPGLAVVADGMGGHACGDVASRLAIEQFHDLTGESERTADDVLDAIERANSAILQDADRNPDRAGMGTTLTGLAMVDQTGSPHWLIFNIGDSRVYRVADGHLAQLTVDHSEVAELLATGQITADAARMHPLRHVVTRSLGSAPSPHADTWLQPACPGDFFLICSDGLTREVDEADIARHATSLEDLDACAAALVDAAVRAGGRDNVTVVLIRSLDVDAIMDEAVTLTIPRALLNAEDQ